MTTKNPHGGRRNGAGRHYKPLDERKPRANGTIQITISADTAVLSQRLMLHFPDVPNVEALFAYALRRLAETTDDYRNK